MSGAGDYLNMGITTETGGEMAVEAADELDRGQDALYERISAEFGAALGRVARAHEAGPSLSKQLICKA